MAEQSPAQNSAQNPGHNPEPGLWERARAFINRDQQVCAEPAAEPHAEHPPGGPLSFAVAVMTLINRGFTSAFHAATRDGTLSAAFRQGTGEMGEALKAFPDSIHVQEPGTVLNPTQGEIAASRDLHAPPPGMIVKDNAGGVHGQEQAQSPSAPSPSDIARGRADTVHGQQQGNVQAQPSPSDIAHDNREGQVLTQEKPPEMGWAERIERDVKPPGMAWPEWIEQQRKGNQDGNGGNDQNERERNRSLPDEQREQEKEQEKERGRDR